MNDAELTERRYRRQRDIVPPERLSLVRASVIGVGAVGRQVAIQLAAMGVPQLQLIDPEVVEPENLAPQAFLDADLGRPKVWATADLCHQLSPRAEIETCQTRFRRSLAVGNVVLCCVDSIQIRASIWRTVQGKVDLFIDGRMSAEVVRVLTAGDAPGRRHYPTTLFPSAEAHVGPCTAKSTVFCANVVAGLMLEQFARWLRGLPLDADLICKLLASECVVTTPPAA